MSVAAEPVPVPKASVRDLLSSDERQELERLRAYRRRRGMEEMISMGALGGGGLLAGFGLIPALIGMVIGGSLGYLVERRAKSASSTPQR